MDSGLRQQVEENRKSLEAHCQNCYPMWSAELRFTGHRDWSCLNLSFMNHVNKLDDALVASNSSNFRALLNFRVDAGDTILEEHLLQSAHNATYVSKTTQNDLIESCGNVIRQKISDNVHKAKYFTVLADETTDFRELNSLLHFTLRFSSL